MKVFLKKIFRFPTPVDLCLSTHNALPSRKITPNCKGPTWEDYYEILKFRYPIKYFIYNMFYNLYLILNSRIFRPINDMVYWLKCHILKKYKYHLLDIRQPKNKHLIDDYQYGYIVVADQMLYAIINLLKIYIHNESDLSMYYTAEEIENNEGIKRQYGVYKEVKDILQWWDVDRKNKLLRYDDMLSEWSKSKKKIPYDEKYSDQLFDNLNKFHESIDSETDDMLIRALKIRKYMWD